MTKSAFLAQYVVLFSLFSVMLLGLPTSAHAASYAYIDILGNIRSVVATSWSSAIATAPNISNTSGVLLLTGPTGFHVVGNKIVFGNQ